ncbi:flavin reductase family protein [Prauserella oleivorans]|uniref:Flavin reductase family protein n=1 Tax=Prauserella oleivorans TaxID=1478153 RepID=A0ABW5W6X1_9PSEU
MQSFHTCEFRHAVGTLATAVRVVSNELLRHSGTFRVNVLATRHRHVADSFAGRPWPGHRAWDSGCGEWDTASADAPRLLDAPVSFECVPDRVVPAGSHDEYLGAVTATHTHTGTGPPLVHADHTFHQPTALGVLAHATAVPTRSTSA